MDVIVGTVAADTFEREKPADADFNHGRAVGLVAAKVLDRFVDLVGDVALRGGIGLFLRYCGAPEYEGRTKACGRNQADIADGGMLRIGRKPVCSGYR